MHPCTHASTDTCIHTHTQCLPPCEDPGGSSSISRKIRGSPPSALRSRLPSLSPLKRGSNRGSPTTEAKRREQEEGEGRRYKGAGERKREARGEGEEWRERGRGIERGKGGGRGEEGQGRREREGGTREEGEKERGKGEGNVRRNNAKNACRKQVEMKHVSLSTLKPEST